MNLRIKIRTPGMEGWMEVVQFECLGTMKASLTVVAKTGVMGLPF